MNDFGEMFERLTGHKPMSWQRRLHEQWLANHVVPVIDLPTGMGKTHVMAIWLIARATQMQESRPKRLPTRLIYVVDRRTVVDQATALAEKIKAGADGVGIEAPIISTLRGQLADSRDWTRDPSRPAIIIGTVDMIGSRLLFSGYRSSYKQHPLDAGLLGQDSILILDEAHLSAPFSKLLESISENGPFQRGQGRPVWVVRMSATIGGEGGGLFQLSADDLGGNKGSNVIVRRYQAEKHLYLHDPTEDVRGEIVKTTAGLAGDNSRVVVFVRSPDDAIRIRGKIVDSGDAKDKPFSGAVEVLTGTMRGLERDELLKKPVMRRFLDPANRPAEGPAILVSTSAGEVGFDLNADHLVCDAAPLDSVIQRFGRVNRRGDGCASVHLFPAKPKDKKKKGDNEAALADSAKHTYEAASARTVEILKQLPKLPDNSLDASPKALADLPKREDALTPKPTIRELTDILLDAWSMTTIAEPMPGRPPVAEWLRGIAADMPDTTIAWRAELDVDGFGDLDVADIEEWFDAHRVLPHETLTVPFQKAADFLVRRWDTIGNTLGSQEQKRIGERPCVIDQGGLRSTTLGELVDWLKRRQTRDILDAEIILPASFGGIKRGDGLLDPEIPKPTPGSNADGHATAADVADAELGGPAGSTWQRHRLIGDGELEKTLCGDEPVNSDTYSRFVLDLPSEDDTVRQIISLVSRRDRPEYGSRPQALAEHLTAAERCADQIVSRLQLQHPVAQALKLAAGWHDAGKCRPAWQNAVGGTMDQPLAKSGGPMRPIAGSYRHEFGSLREFTDKYIDHIDSDIFDLAAHLIATHHGRGRPHFPKGGFDPGARAKSPEIAVEVMRRFARLQRKYGYWRLAWMENLLRCADAMASEENNRGAGR